MEVDDRSGPLAPSSDGAGDANEGVRMEEGSGKAVAFVEGDEEAATETSGAGSADDGGGGRGAGLISSPSSSSRFGALEPFAIISLSYCLFTVTDGALRMIVLLHAFTKGFDAFEVALMFTLYETMGVVTNFLAGVFGALWGIKSTLLVGLCLQVVSIALLYAWDDAFTKEEAIVFVTAAQGLSGVAKDLVKLGGKSVTKLVTPDEKQSQLFKLVSFITGLKNSLKGAGYFVGAALLAASYNLALAVLIGLVVLAMPWAALRLSSDLGTTRKENVTLEAIFKKNHNVNTLSLARMFLFGSRDLWFEVPLPFFLRSADGFGWPREAVGAFLAGYIILYGQLQSWSPQAVLSPLGQDPPNKYSAALWAWLLLPVTVALAATLQFSAPFVERDVDAMIALLTALVALFAVVFAVNSAVHSYLIVKYSEGDKVAMNVGFYYMANAAGRLVGTLVSGALYAYSGDTRTQGLAHCFWTSAGFVVVASLATDWIHDDAGGLPCGPLGTCLLPSTEPHDGHGENDDNDDDENAGEAVPTRV